MTDRHVIQTSYIIQNGQPSRIVPVASSSEATVAVTAATGVTALTRQVVGQCTFKGMLPARFRDGNT